ncbi:uncharacterized protein N7469_000117 [Penicillium citrinum]|uniref:Endoplasmic reticulum junction formation protein lunapark n=1 Tax=Penicillium citrinum TaxID=5077 RepID=A0A9W9PC30_PENCI|nr:uncharacterized protein N7469_000117 [Penicillium citrinum]KAJ5241790.1 hypothetical protein N7469_000117 [Penicillium citrinum]
MVSLWPWRGEDTSPAGFEKTLSTLSSKIAEATSRLDQNRSSARRFKALWTLYSTFAYLFYTIVLALVIGWETWGVRTLGSRIFDYRISRIQRRLNEYNKQRDETIEKLKVATKYNSTQQLLEKYGGESPKQSKSPNANAGPASNEKQKPVTPSQPVARTGLPPPPTANIRRLSPQGQPFAGSESIPSPLPGYPSPPQQVSDQPQFPPNTPPSPPSHTPQSDEPGFAPNAFTSSGSGSGQYIEQPHWYDRLLDVLLGEDEMQPRNRMAMICASCRLVNGQAPPGIKTPEELGRWRCGSCGAWNGVESETSKMLSTLKQRAPGRGSWDAGQTSTEDVSSHTDDDAVMVENGADDVEQGDAEQVKEESGDEVKEEKTASEPVRRSKRKGGKK